MGKRKRDWTVKRRGRERWGMGGGFLRERIRNLHETRKKKKRETHPEKKKEENSLRLA